MHSRFSSKHPSPLLISKFSKDVPVGEADRQDGGHATSGATSVSEGEEEQQLLPGGADECGEEDERSVSQHDRCANVIYEGVCKLKFHR